VAESSSAKVLSWRFCAWRTTCPTRDSSAPIRDLSPGGNADSYLPWLALSYSGVVLLSAELMCASGGGEVSRNMVCKRLDQERPVVAIADRFRCGGDHAEDIDI